MSCLLGEITFAFIMWHFRSAWQCCRKGQEVSGQCCPTGGCPSCVAPKVKGPDIPPDFPHH